MTHNPYLPPQAAVVATPAPDAHEGCWREGRDLFMRRGAKLPPRCVICNAPARTPMKERTVHWHGAGWYLLILVGLLFYFIAALFVRKSWKVQPGFCDAHTASRRRWIAFAWLLALVSVGLWYMAEPLTLVGGGLGLLVATVIGVRASNPLSPRYIDYSQAQLRGCGKPFLDSLRGRR